MAFIDGTVVNVALPALQSALHASVTDIQWVVESYALFLASLLLLGGSLGDLYGRRKIFLSGVVLFAIGSSWCGLASSIASLILARSVQGIGAAFLVPGNQDGKRYFEEPLFIAANIRYDPTQADESLATRSWDPWAAFLDWNSDRSYGKVLDVFPNRSTIEKIIVVAVPLYSITSIQAAIQTINLVGRPDRDPRAVPIG
jgi:hypothetical protein